MKTRTRDETQAQETAFRYLGDTGLTFMEFVMREPLPLSVVQDAVFEFLQHRDDAVVYGAQAVNAYVRERRATEDVDLASTRGKQFADELRTFLSDRLRIAARVREVRDGLDRIRWMPATNGGPGTYVQFGPGDHKGYKGDFLTIRELRGGQLRFDGYYRPEWPSNREV